jgi:hypothetical protein
MMLSSARRHLIAALNTSGFSRSSNRSGLGPVLEQLGGMMRRLGTKSTAARMLLVGLALLAGGARAARAESTGCSVIGSNYALSAQPQYAYAGTFNAGEVITLVSQVGGPDLAIGTGDPITTLLGTVNQAGGSLTFPSTGTWTVAAEEPVGTIHISCTAPQTTFTVTTTADDATGVAANCATGSSTACTLRDALAAAAASTSTGLTVNFATSLAGSSGTTPFTITETGGTLNLPSNTTIQGLTTGTGGTLTNLVTVNGNAKYTVFTVNGMATALDNLTITNGGISGSQGASRYGGVYVQSGSLTVNQCTISNNTASSVGAGGINNASGSTLTVNQSLFNGNTGGGSGGGIYNAGSVTVTSSTFVNNVTSYSGGGLYNATGATATLSHVTMTANLAVSSGGGVDSAGTLGLSYTIVEANNTLGTYADIQSTGGMGSQGLGNVVNMSSSSTSNYTAATLGLAALGNYGGPTQTMPVMPIFGGPVFCQVPSTTAPTASVDQRGFQGATSYGSSVYCTDAGATNESYNIAWTTQPAASYVVGADFPTTGPILSFEDNGYVLPFTQVASVASVQISDHYSYLNGTGRANNFGWTNGAASFSTVSFPTVVPTDYLNAEYTIEANPYPGLNAPSSSSFAVVPLLAGFQIGGLPTSIQAGGNTGFNVTALSSLSPATTATGYTGTVTFTSTDSAASLPASYTFTTADGGSHSFPTGSLIFKTAAAAQTITVADTTASVSQTSTAVQVTAGVAANNTATGSTTISTQDGTAFASTALQVQVTDAYGNPKSNTPVIYTVPSTGPTATLSSSSCTTNSSGICAVTATANALAGTYTISALAAGVATPVTFNATNTGVATFTVTVATDTTTGVASNCTEGGTTDPSCSLRDALAAAAAVASSQVYASINFGSVFNTATTITEVHGTLNIPTNTTVSGPTTIISGSRRNLVTVSGNNANTVFTVANTVSGAAILHLTITSGYSSQGGGGISNVGNLTVNLSTLTGNSAQSGGGIYNSGSLTVYNSTLNSNGASTAGGGIYSNGTLTVNSSTFYNNGANGNGGGIDVASGTAAITQTTVTGNNSPTASGIFNAGTLTLSGSIVAGNSVVDILGSYTAGAVANTAPATTGGNAAYTAAQLLLAPLGFYGGATQTMPVLPTSPAFCIVRSNTQGTTSNDQRGVAIPTKYATTYCTDAGATNSSYSLAWTTQPAAAYYVNMGLSTSPVVQFEDNGYAIPASGVAYLATAFDTSSCLGTGGYSLTLSSTGSATWPSTCTFSQTETSDSFTAYYHLTFPGTTGGPDIAAPNSNTFNVVPNVVGFTVSTLPTPETAGTSQTFTVTALSSLSPATTATNYTGTVSFTSTDTAASLPASYTFTSADNGVHTFTNGLTFKTAGSSQTFTVADSSASVSKTSNTVTVNAAAAASIVATNGTTISTQNGTAFGSTALQVQVTDAYGNAVPSATVTFAVQGAIPTATLSPTTCVTNSSGTCAVTATANAQAGTYTITATVSGLTPVTFNATNIGVADFFVTVFTDTTTGIASHCTQGSSTDVSCSLRDALAAAAAITNSQVNAYVLVGAHSATTITEVNGTLQIPAYTSVGGPLSSTGTNLVTVSGNSTGPVFTVASGTSYTSLSSLTITGGSGSQGGGIKNAGTLTVNSCTLISNSAASGSGGGIWSSGTLNVNDSFFYNNGSGVGGGAIYSTGTLTVISSTFYNNGANGNGGAIDIVSGNASISHATITGNGSQTASGIYNGGTLTLSGSIVAGNSVVDILGSYTAGAVANIAPPTSGGNSSYTAAQLLLAPFGNYGGPTMTMPVLPTSPAFCILRTSTQGTPSADQRGVATPTLYGSSYCTDAGATNSSYSLAWTTQPASTYYVNVGLSTLPVLQFEDNGYAIPASGSVYLADAVSDSPCSGMGIGDLQALSSTGSATWPSTCTFPQTETNDSFTAYLYLKTSATSNGTLAPPNSNKFNVVPNVVGFTITPNLPTPETAGTPETFTVTALSSLSPATTATNYTGTVTFTSTDPAASLPASYTFTSGTGADNGVHTFTSGLTFKTAGAAQTITVADTAANVSQVSNSVAVTAAVATTVVASSGTPQSVAIGQAFTNPLVVQVQDAYGNPVGGITVTFTAPTSGPSATLSTSSCATVLTATPSGSCHVTATANGTASATVYNVTASGMGLTIGTFALTNLKVSPGLTVTFTPTTTVYGQPVSVTATLTPSTVAGTTATGGPNLLEDTSSLTSSNWSAGVATAGNGISTVGLHTFSATYAGDSNFNPVSKVTAMGSLTVNKATPTQTGPTTQPVQIVVNSTGVTVPVQVGSQYTSTGANVPGQSGGSTETYTYLLNGQAVMGASGSVTVTPGTIAAGYSIATIPVPTVVATVPGLYTLNVSFGGDVNFLASPTPLGITVQIGLLTPTVTYPAQTAITYGATLAANLNATTAYTTTSLTSGGTTAYTAMLLPGGTPVAVTGTTALTPGTYTLTATWTPNTTNAVTYKPASGTTTLVVNPAGVTIGTTPITESYGGIASGTATVSGVAGFAVPTGTLSYSVDSGTVTRVTLSNGQTAVSIPSLTGGAHTLSLGYGGDGNYAATTTNTVVNFTVTKATTSVAGSAVTQTYGTATSSTVNVTGYLGAATPTGTITYSVDGGTAVMGTLVSGAYTVPVAAALAAGSHTIALTYNGDGNYGTSTGSVSFTTATATLTVTGVNATKAYGAAVPSLTANVTGQQNGDTFVATATTVATAASAAGSYPIVPAVTGANVANYTVNLVNASLTVTQITPAVALSVSAAAILTQNAETLTATVSSSVSVPTGSVTFLDGTTSLGTVPLTAGVATLTTSTLSIATHSITAMYSGDTNFVTLTSAAQSIQVLDFRLAISTTAGSVTSATIVPGGTATYLLTISPTGSPTFPAAVTLTVTGLPAGATYTLTPATIAAGAGATSVTLTITAPVVKAKLEHGPVGRGLAPMMLALVFLPFSRKLRKRAGRLGSVALLLLLSAGVLTTLTGCGYSTGFFAQPAQSYTVTVTGTAGALSHSTTVTLTVE